MSKTGTKFTPGPWQFYELPNKPFGMGYIRPEDEDGMEIAHHGDMDRPEEENLANAHLIEQAPNLYRGLLEAYAFIDGLEHFGVMPEGVVQPDMDHIRTTLAKAVR